MKKIGKRRLKEKKRRIERKRGVEIWRKIEDEIRSDIMEGKIKKGESMNEEIEMEENFGVNSNKVRNEIEEMKKEGVMREEKGRGNLIENEKRIKNKWKKK